MRCAPPQSPGVSPLDMLLGPRWPAEGHTKEVDSSSPASFSSPLYRLTTPAAREEQGTSLYLRSNIAPHAPRAGSAKEATSGVFAGPAWPDFASPAAASLGAIPARPPVAARAAGEAAPAGLDGSGNSMDLNVPKLGPAATSPGLRRTAPSSAEGHRHALGVVAAREVRAWCWSFFCWLPLSHGLAQVCLHQGGTFRCAATRATSALTGFLTCACRALLVRLGDGSKDSLMSLSCP